MPSWSDNESVENIFDGNPDTFYHNNRNNFVSADNPFVLVADMFDNRNLQTDNKPVMNPAVRTILNLHSVNLL